jgi:hypothetical protein
MSLFWNIAIAWAAAAGGVLVLWNLAFIRAERYERSLAAVSSRSERPKLTLVDREVGLGEAIPADRRSA